MEVHHKAPKLNTIFYCEQGTTTIILYRLISNYPCCCFIVSTKNLIIKVGEGDPEVINQDGYKLTLKIKSEKVLHIYQSA
jgi:hypothetical protein